jgi:hypothetical protein
LQDESEKTEEEIRGELSELNDAESNIYHVGLTMLMEA